MKFIYNNRLMFWVLLFLVVINISALVSKFFFSAPLETADCCPPEKQQCSAFREELNLSAEQAVLVTGINKKYTDSAAPVATAIREARVSILNELDSEKPDTMLLNNLAGKVASLQLRIQKENIAQYTALKRVCTPQQAQKLSALYRDLYGCPMQNPQMQHRHRNGQGKANQVKCE